MNNKETTLDSAISFLLDYSLSTEDLIYFTCFDVILLLLFLVLAKHFIVDNAPSTREKEVSNGRIKRLSWCLTCLNSAVSSLLSFIYIFLRFFYNGKYNTAQNLSVISLSLEVSPRAEVMLLGIDNFSLLMVLNFASVNVIDLIYGSVYYPDYVDLVTGWVHHTAYIWMMISCSTGRAFFFTCDPFTKAIGMLLSLEIPTFIMSFGQLFPSLRSDYGFGLTYFVLRILFHAYIVLCMALCHKGFQSGHYFFILSSFCMHVYWFSGWCKKFILQYIFPSRNRLSDNKIK